MSIPKAIFIGSLSLFAVIGGLALFKKKGDAAPKELVGAPTLTVEATEVAPERSQQYLQPVQDEVAEEEMDQVWRLFTKGKQKLPVVETVRYKSRVSWLKGRPAWITDYAAHFSTSRHFIARSLNGKKDYYTQKISPGDQFNILKKDVNFYLVVDLSRCKLWFYVLDGATNERHLLKTYKVGLGRFDEDSYSGLLTPKGKFSLGDKVAIYKTGMSGYFQDDEVEMVRVLEQDGSHFWKSSVERETALVDMVSMVLHGYLMWEPKRTVKIFQQLEVMKVMVASGLHKTTSKNCMPLLLLSQPLWKS